MDVSYSFGAIISLNSIFQSALLDNIELFNIYASRLLVSLYDSFPVPIVIRPEDYVGNHVPIAGTEPDEDSSKGENKDWLESCAEYESHKQKRQVFTGTIHFLHNERLVRFLHPRNMSVGKEIAPDDILIDRATQAGSKERLNFVLTAHGLAQLSKTVTGGKVMSDTLIAKLKGVLTNEAVKAVPGVAISSTIPWLGSLLGG